MALFSAQLSGGLTVGSAANRQTHYVITYADCGRGVALQTRYVTLTAVEVWLFIQTSKSGILMYGALVLFESEFVHVVAISFTALVLTELLMVALTIRTWHWLMVVAEFLSLGCYVSSLAFLNEYFVPALTIHAPWMKALCPVGHWPAPPQHEALCPISHWPAPPDMRRYVPSVTGRLPPPHEALCPIGHWPAPPDMRRYVPSVTGRLPPPHEALCPIGHWPTPPTPHMRRCVPSVTG
ncbi:hypothetical protein P7K49_027867 [Saguinus oedipus]|uniref:Uncharacterized protein n=1 Tax=Saguinus oedipus TaxID=9490 RepID=A0ABQ9UAM4_SAGOE|nr:hypothetical protein P7K49_027867 [Saguinus oedipus]